MATEIQDEIEDVLTCEAVGGSYHALPAVAFSDLRLNLSNSSLDMGVSSLVLTGLGPSIVLAFGRRMEGRVTETSSVRLRV